ncbi:MAG TPA: bifunctional diguanylate cyclase/phosphodiesterase, partial [Desulfuromonadales bacterium]|nr:bifunctional diguanylate cyclase/phosphodiesterase [Desulfuromonadales bacterium]
IDSILTTLLNIVASTRAIEIYTQELEFHATRDPLTNLYNQRIFWELLDNEVMRAERNGHKFALLVLDLDNFKNINDSLGHPTGDIYLIEIANHIQQLLRSSDTLARYGGDEFVAILPGADEHLGHQVANRINEAVRSFSVVAPDGSMARTTVSVGYAVFPTHATRGKDLFLFADNMTYRAKTAGKNTVARPTTTDLINVLQKANEKINLILKAMEEERVVPFFQPIVGLAKGEVFGHEVLCRLETDQGLMAAGEFIDIAERFGVIARLDHLVMEKAFAKMRRENYQGMLFVNISPMCLMAEDFLTSIVTLTDQYGIAHEKIVFELTERQTISNMSMLKKFSQDIRQYGFMLAIDDFGSGYSSFSYMRNLPIDFLKIEGEFIQNIDKGENDRTVVKSIAALARKFKISVIGEYVESAAILQILQEIQVDFAQGYYTGRPMPDFYAETTAVDFNAGISPKSAGS